MGLVLLSSAKIAAAALTVVSGSREPITAESLSLEVRIIYGLLCLFCAWLTYLLGMGLWRLRNWARLILIVLLMFDIMLVKALSLLGPFQRFLESDPVLQILGRIVTSAVVCYLFIASVKSAFGVTDLRRRWLYACGAVALFSLGSTLYHSKAEFQALRWHRQHGNQITVEGVTFPVYRWYAPHFYETGFDIVDSPGPLRPNDRFAFITVESCREDCTLTPRQLAEKKFESYKKDGYTDIQFVQRQIRGETLECVDRTWLARSLECYGTSPIGHIYFVGNESSYERLNRMLTEAR